MGDRLGILVAVGFYFLLLKMLAMYLFDVSSLKTETDKLTNDSEVELCCEPNANC